MTDPRTRTNWQARLEEAAQQLEQRNTTIEVLRVLYPPNPAVVVQIDKGAPRSFSTVKEAALHLEEGLRWI